MPREQCPVCAASCVWVSVPKVTRERGGNLVFLYRCTVCEYEWTIGAPRAKPPRATLRPRRRRRA